MEIAERSTSVSNCGRYSFSVAEKLLLLQFGEKEEDEEAEEAEDRDQTAAADFELYALAGVILTR
jgi:hypothetical protein